MRRLLFSFSFALSFGLGPLTAQAAETLLPRPDERGARPPNFVLIFTDDQGYQDVGCFGSPDIRTPNLDRMAAEGMRFTDFYVGAPVCSASRAALLTGSYCHRVGVTGVFFPERRYQGLHPQEETIAEVLKPAGYATACVGKWHLGDAPEFLPTRQGFDEYFGIPYSNDMAIWWRGKNGPPLMRGEEIVELPAVQATLTRRYTEEAVRFIRANKARPFFLYLAHTMPHIPLAASESFRGKSPRGLYGDVIEELDDSVGKVLAALEEAGVDEHTLVVFTSDNGPWLQKKRDGGSAGPLRAGKFTNYEGGMRVPCIARWPGVVPGAAVQSAVASTLDLLPTFAALAGAKRRRAVKIDGADISAMLRGGALPGRRETPFFYDLNAVRVGDWKLLLAGKGPKKNFPALYNLAEDIGETTNRYRSEPEVVARLASLLAAHRKDIRQTARPVGQAQPPAPPADLPRVLLLGDSISMGYTQAVRGMLRGEAAVFRPMQTDRRKGRSRPENCAGTDKGIANLARWLAADGGRWDVIHFNFGLHDLKHVHPKTGANSNRPEHPHQTPPAEYRVQLARITDELQKTGAALVYATTTPYPSGVKPLRLPTDAVRYNDIARELMAARGIPINDLYSFALPRLEEIQQPVNVHFHRKGSVALAREVVRHVRAALAAKKK